MGHPVFKVFYAVMASELRMFFQNRLALFWMIVFPLLLFAILFGAFGSPSNLGALRLEIADRDDSAESRQFLALLKHAFAAAQVVDLDVIVSSTVNEHVRSGEGCGDWNNNKRKC